MGIYSKYDLLGGGKNMVQITIIDNKTVVKVNDIEIFINGDFEIRKKEPACTGSKD